MKIIAFVSFLIYIVYWTIAWNLEIRDWESDRSCSYEIKTKDVSGTWSLDTFLLAKDAKFGIGDYRGAYFFYALNPFGVEKKLKNATIDYKVVSVECIANHSN